LLLSLEKSATRRRRKAHTIGSSFIQYFDAAEASGSYNEGSDAQIKQFAPSNVKQPNQKWRPRTEPPP